MALIQIPTELLEPWYEKFEKLIFVPAIPRRYSGFGKVSLLLSFEGYGYCQVIPESEDVLYLFFIHISPEHRRQGHGKSFMSGIVQLAQEIGYKRIKLDVGYLDPTDRIPAPVLRKFYKGLGFKNVKGTIMSLEIPQPSNILVDSNL